MNTPTETRQCARDRLLGLDRAIRSRLRESPRGSSHSVSDRQLTRLLEIAKAMNRIHDHDELLVYVSERLRELFDAQNSFVILFDDAGRPVIQSSHLEGPNRGAMPVSQTLLERVRISREPVIIDDAMQHSDLKGRNSIEELRIASALCAPLIVDDEVIGILQFDQRGDPQPFPETDLRLLSLFADQVATALNSLRLIGQIKTALAETHAAQAKLVQAERLSALGEMAGGIAHNFNNALFVALGLCDVVLAKHTLEEDVKSAVERIRTCALDAANTVRRLKGFSRGRGPDEKEPGVYPADVVAELPELTRNRWQGEADLRGIAIEVRTEIEPTPAVRANAAELREILTNLLFNAVDAMDADGRITISTGMEGDRVFVRVRDEGIGMDEAVQRHVFEPFFTTKGTAGSGFGLSTCWSIARCLGGEITVDSTPGEGSAFTVWLPAARGVLPAAPCRRVYRSEGARILVVDDDPAVRHTIAELLGVLGHRVTALSSGEDVLDALAREGFDLLVSDVGMPGMSGNELAREVSTLRPELPVVLLTGWGSDVALDPEVARMVDQVLAKPVTLELLRDALARALSSAPS